MSSVDHTFPSPPMSVQPSRKNKTSILSLSSAPRQHPTAYRYLINSFRSSKNVISILSRQYRQLYYIIIISFFETNLIFLKIYYYFIIFLLVFKICIIMLFFQLFPKHSCLIIFLSYTLFVHNRSLIFKFYKIHFYEKKTIHCLLLVFLRSIDKVTMVLQFLIF